MFETATARLLAATAVLQLVAAAVALRLVVAGELPLVAAAAMTEK